MDGRLRGRTVIVTRERPGELGVQLEAHGAEVVHMPLVEIDAPADGGAALVTALARLDDYDWLIITSPNGAQRLAAAAEVVPAVSFSRIRLAAVGRSTAAAMRDATGRDVDLIPGVQTIEGMLAEFPRARDGGRILAARGDRADPALVGGLTALGWSVDDIVAYRTVGRVPTAVERSAAETADVVTFASGSAVTAWVDAFGPDLAAELGLKVVVIGPSTAKAAREAGVEVTTTATPHSIDGLVVAVVDAAGTWVRGAPCRARP